MIGLCILNVSNVKEVLPAPLDSTSEAPPLSDGGFCRLYIHYQCPYAQRTWITRNYKGLQDKIKLVAIDLVNRPAWYKNKVPSLEHDNKVIGESLDVLRYLDAHFEGPALLPDDPAKREFAEELFKYTDTFYKIVTSSVKGDVVNEAGVAFDHLESALQKFEGPFFLGDLSLVDFAYIPFVERFQIFIQEVCKYDVTTGRPKLEAWIQELNKMDAYTVTKADPTFFVQNYKKRFLGAYTKLDIKVRIREGVGRCARARLIRALYSASKLYKYTTPIYPFTCVIFSSSHSTIIISVIMSYVKEVFPQPLDSTSQPPPLFDGTTRLYINYQCPYAQRVWIARNYKGLQDKIKIVPIDLANRPTWYKDKVYPQNKVPSLEHDNKVIGESLDLLRYIDANFEGPALLPNDPAKREFAEELLTYTDTFFKTVASSFKGDVVKEAGVAFDYLESALHKFEGPFFLGDISLVDFAYIPFVERFHLFIQETFKYDVTTGRPKLAKWIEELNNIDAYTVTKADPEHVIQMYKKRLLGQ
ncbi:hypothetical protein QVD17_11574 [Tagetes erecta]|uniref:glutathione transferase n=1 Tax=Tagetes erecta TaxID=13708 RepID=A0AAD8KYF1_TARER|nr:hypothetical protein QVD17_11574 [Tagetes erecta]